MFSCFKASKTSFRISFVLGISESSLPSCTYTKFFKKFKKKKRRTHTITTLRVRTQYQENKKTSIVIIEFSNF